MNERTRLKPLRLGSVILVLKDNTGWMSLSRIYETYTEYYQEDLAKFTIRRYLTELEEEGNVEHMDVPCMHNNRKSVRMWRAK